ncbi:Decaprenyl diphosphate synthase-like protein [Papiliotrema laurentii]|uniref:Alkyl transferase n=1 Tax=Papiliotrema laurentii TaxID=5418 RepID=A0AAD9FSU9_PAPLA|nr:Decaprenyl diphosphate synthase-like protein [Papiliotrema laurentii]
MGQSRGLVSNVLHRVHALLTTILLYLLALGPMPRHVGFVMDGNRRYARTKGMKVTQGHTDGFQSLRRTLEVCLKLKIRAVSIYAFAIDNFSRDENEVDALMGLARTRLMELCQHGDLLQEYGVRVRFIGRREMLPEYLRIAIKDMEEMTGRNQEGVLNVCCPYSSRDEITHAVEDVLSEVTDGDLRASDITSERIYSNLEICQSVRNISARGSRRAGLDDPGKLDILVRTSNVKRLSDFMMWQANDDTQLHFVKTYWPEFGLTDMLPILLGWQQKQWLRNLM